jgi:hypothetical protein
MITEEAASRQMQALYKEGSALVEEFEAEQRSQPKRQRRQKSTGNINVIIRRFSALAEDEPKEEEVPEPTPTDNTQFGKRYQSWYTRTLPLMKQLAPDRYAEFQTFYMPDPRYARRDTETHFIREYLQGHAGEDAVEQTVLGFKNQLAILQAVSDRLAWSTLESEDHRVRSQQLAMLEAARKLIKISECAAGVIAGTVLSDYLKALAIKHHVKFRKRSPPPAELAEALKEAKVLDASAWSLAVSIADIHDRCLQKGESPTKADIRDLIDGARWLLANIF